MLCYYCKHKIEVGSDYSFTLDGKLLHPECKVKLQKARLKAQKEEENKRKQRTLERWNFMDSDVNV